MRQKKTIFFLHMFDVNRCQQQLYFKMSNHHFFLHKSLNRGFSRWLTPTPNPLPPCWKIAARLPAVFFVVGRDVSWGPGGGSHRNVGPIHLGGRWMGCMAWLVCFQPKIYKFTAKTNKNSGEIWKTLKNWGRWSKKKSVIFFQYGWFNHQLITPPKLAAKAPENAWLEDDPLLFGYRLIFRGELSVLGRVDHSGTS